MCSSGTTAIHALVQLYQFLKGKELNWVVSSFGFPATIQGPLQKAQVVDCCFDGMLDLEKLQNLDFDGIVATNIFGTQLNLDKYKEYCEKESKILLSDSATALNSSKHFSGEAISFHHTKPWGTGEGGCCIIEKSLASKLRSIINFGMISGEKVGRWAFNGKISDIACAFILQRFKQLPLIEGIYRKQYERIVTLAVKLGINILAEHKKGIPCHVPLIFDSSIAILENPWVKLHKYYCPLDAAPVANNLYSRIINFPCHSEIQSLSDETISTLLEQLLQNRGITRV